MGAARQVPEGVARAIATLPKAELHIHLEGTLEPEMMLRLAERNGVPLPFRTAEEVHAAYAFDGLESFLQIYYLGTTALCTAEDFYDLTLAYLRRANTDNVKHVEPFFDPQAHTSRGVTFAAIVGGITQALDEGRRQFGITSRLTMCFLRDRPTEEAMRTLEEAVPHLERITTVGLDSAEVGNPPSEFAQVFARGRALGLHAVAHAGEEGPPAYVYEALDALRAERIDHGVRCMEDPRLVERLVRERIPLTVCPLSNIALRVFDAMEQHPLKRMLDSGLLVCVNSDDPAYFGGYVNENYSAAAADLGLGADDIRRLARASFEASFLTQSEKAEWQRALE